MTTFVPAMIQHACYNKLNGIGRQQHVFDANNPLTQCLFAGAANFGLEKIIQLVYCC
jgi:hypothetical protein